MFTTVYYELIKSCLQEVKDHLVSHLIIITYMFDGSIKY